MATKVQIFYFEAGGGHASAARALAAVLVERPAGGAMQIERVNLQQLLDPLDPVQRLTGLRLQDLYNQLLAREWTWGLGAAARLLQATIRARRGAIEAALGQWFGATRPDLVVSVIPHFNPLLAAALRRVNAQARFVLILTDLADPEPSFWLAGLEPGAEGWPHTVVCGSTRAVAQALARGIAARRIAAVSGMILRPAFHQTPPEPCKAADERRALGLDPELPTALVLAGGAGGKGMLEVARQLERVDQPLQAIYLCGRNRKVAAMLRARGSRLPMRVEEFTEEVPRFMRCADVFIGKPGPGSVSEAIHMGLPAIVISNARTLPQERFNAEWLEQEQLGFRLRHWRELPATLERLLPPATLNHYRQRARAQANRAVFEIAELLEGLSATRSG